jgi:RimJ/RimL family protein N-acetyltransferase
MNSGSSAEGSRIGFRPTTAEDLELVLRLERDDKNAPFVRQWPLEKHRAAVDDENVAHWIIYRTPDNKPIGYQIIVGLQDLDHNIEFKRLVIDDKGKGIGRQVLQHMKKVAFEEWGAHRVWLEVSEQNERAYHLIRSEGFIQEGVHRKSLKKGDDYYSLRVLSMLADEYNREKSESL